MECVSAGSAWRAAARAAGGKAKGERGGQRRDVCFFAVVPGVTFLFRYQANGAGLLSLLEDPLKTPNARINKPPPAPTH